MDKDLLSKVLSSSQNFSILCVEDDILLSDSLRSMFENIFKDVEFAKNGEEALEKISLRDFDIIVTDLIMPKMGGIEFIEKIRDVNLFVPILILSAFDDTENFLQTIKLGIDGYLIKPLEFDQLVIILAKVLRKLELEKANLEYKNELEAKVEIKTRELRHKCFHEFYTGLPNSIMLHEDLKHKNYSHIMLLDISDFSIINKEYGKSFANRVIVRTAQVLSKHINKKSMLYKVESDRYVIALEDYDKEKIHQYCMQIISFFDTKNVKVDEVEIHVSFNIGVAELQEDGSETIINSEYALEKSKQLGSRNYEIFNMQTAYFEGVKESIKQLKDTRRLILEEKIFPYFQPIKDIAKDEVLKYEVLARGILDGQLYLPYQFIHAGEQLGLITAITRRIINKSFEFFQGKSYTFSINITERDLIEGYLPKFLEEKLKFYEINPTRVTFEILEHITISQSTSEITEQLSILKEMGFSLAVDDFGVENSNFSRLLDTHVDYLKIDGKFIRDLEVNMQHRMVTKAIVNLAKTLEIKTVAEFVENENVYNMVKECGVDYAQGYYLGKPKSNVLG